LRKRQIFGSYVTSTVLYIPRVTTVPLEDASVCFLSPPSSGSIFPCNAGPCTVGLGKYTKGAVLGALGKTSSLNPSFVDGMRKPLCRPLERASWYLSRDWIVKTSIFVRKQKLLCLQVPWVKCLRGRSMWSSGDPGLCVAVEGVRFRLGEKPWCCTAAGSAGRAAAFVNKAVPTPLDYEFLALVYPSRQLDIRSSL
jgi:hypothetical protein